MAGGAGGAGGSPNGAAGAAGANVYENQLQYGGAGGDNAVVFTAGLDNFGPFGQGGTGGDSLNLIAQPGSTGAVIITWGNGIPDA